MDEKDLYEGERDWCSLCERVVVENSEHNPRAHKADLVRNRELEQWKQQLHGSSH
jgi:hypothetical protein